MAVNLLPGWAWYPSRTQAAESRGPKQAAPAQLQRVVLHIRRPGQMAGDQKMDYVRGAPFHPQIQGKSERWHQTMKNRVLLENNYLSGDPERQIGAGHQREARRGTSEIRALGAICASCSQKRSGMSLFVLRVSGNRWSLSLEKVWRSVDCSKISVRDCKFTAS
jgi:hypothetical protein